MQHQGLLSDTACDSTMRSATEGGGHLDVLGSIPPEYRKAILDQCARRTYSKGQVIWHQGDSASYVAFLVEGVAMSTYHGASGRSGMTGIWFAGDILGAGNLGASTNRQMTVRCLENSVVYTISMEKFFEIAQRFPELSLAVIRALSVRLRWVTHLALTLETASAFARICAVLVALSDRFAKNHEGGLLLDLTLTNENLAAIVGVSRQFINTALHDLQDKGLIKIRRRKIILTAVEKLEAFAFGE